MAPLFSKELQKGQNVQAVNPSDLTNSQLPAALVTQGAHLGRGTKVRGNLVFGGSARVDGEIDGEITAEGRLHIGATAIVTAHVKAATVVVAGKVSGDVTGSKQIELHSSAKVAGNLVAPVLIIQQGAQFEGHCSMGGAVCKPEKTTVFPKAESGVQVTHSAPVAVRGPALFGASKATAT